MTPDPNSPGIFQAEWTAEKPGTYTVEISAKRGDEDVGRDVLMFQRMDGVAENFHTEQNRDLLEKLSSQTGGRYWQPAGSLQAGQRDSLFRGGNHDARDQGSLEHADRSFF